MPCSAQRIGPVCAQRVILLYCFFWPRFNRFNWCDPFFCCSFRMITMNRLCNTIFDTDNCIRLSILHFPCIYFFFFCGLQRYLCFFFALFYAAYFFLNRHVGYDKIAMRIFNIAFFLFQVQKVKGVIFRQCYRFLFGDSSEIVIALWMRMNMRQ